MKFSRQKLLNRRPLTEPNREHPLTHPLERPLDPDSIARGWCERPEENESKPDTKTEE